jgi:hypothetical protein
MGLLVSRKQVGLEVCVRAQITIHNVIADCRLISCFQLEVM